MNWFTAIKILLHRIPPAEEHVTRDLAPAVIRVKPLGSTTTVLTLYLFQPISQLRPVKRLLWTSSPVPENQRRIPPYHSDNQQQDHDGRDNHDHDGNHECDINGIRVNHGNDDTAYHGDDSSGNSNGSSGMVGHSWHEPSVRYRHRSHTCQLPSGSCGTRSTRSCCHD
jgi:hypothetical protein